MKKMNASRSNLLKVRRISRSAVLLILGFIPVLCCAALAQQGKSAPSKTSLTGRYEGTAKNKAEEVITVTIDLTEKEGSLSGTIISSHGNFTITGGSRDGENLAIEFDADGATGTISVRMNADKLVGTWVAGEDGGPVDVKRVAAREGGEKGKS
jgi:hypothetical protein